MEQVGIIVFYHPHARCGWRNNIPVLLKFFDKFFAYLLGIFPITCIECRLTTAGLFGVIIYIATYMLQHLNHVKSRLRIQLVYKAGNENIYYHIRCKVKK